MELEKEIEKLNIIKYCISENTKDKRELKFIKKNKELGEYFLTKEDCIFFIKKIIKIGTFNEYNKFVWHNNILAKKVKKTCDYICNNRESFIDEIRRFFLQNGVERSLLKEIGFLEGSDIDEETYSEKQRMVSMNHVNQTLKIQEMTDRVFPILESKALDNEGGDQVQSIKMILDTNIKLSDKHVPKVSEDSMDGEEDADELIIEGIDKYLNKNKEI